MKRIAGLLVAALASLTLLGALPEQENGVFRMGMAPVGLNYAFGPAGGFIQFDEQEYVDRFGMFPTTMLWTNAGGDSVSLKLTLSYRAEPAWQKKFEPWDPVPKWNEYEDNLNLILESVKTGTRDTLTWGEIGTGAVKVEELPSRGNMLSIYARATMFGLRIPEDGSAWKVWTELWRDAGQPETRVDLEQDTIVFVRTPIETATDSLNFMRGLNYTWDDTSYFQNVQRSYPNSYIVNTALFDFYYLEENCDSVTVIGNRLIAMWEEVYAETGDTTGTGKELILEKIHDICVDGEAQPLKYKRRL